MSALSKGRVGFVIACRLPANPILLPGDCEKTESGTREPLMHTHGFYPCGGNKGLFALLEK